MNLWSPNFWNVFILGDLNYFISCCILMLVKTCVLLWFCNLIIALRGGCAHSGSLSRDVLLYGPHDEVSSFFVKEADGTSIMMDIVHPER